MSDPLITGFPIQGRRITAAAEKLVRGQSMSGTEQAEIRAAIEAMADTNAAVNAAIVEDAAESLAAIGAEPDLAGAVTSLEVLPKQTAKIFFDNGDGERHPMTYAELLTDIEAHQLATPTVFYDGPTDSTGIGLLPGPNPTLVDVFTPTVEDEKTYNYHCSLYQTADGRVHLQHTQHGREEEGKGSYTTYWYSDDNGDEWTDGGVLMPGMIAYDVSIPYGDNPRPLPGGWCVVDGTLYAIQDSVRGAGQTIGGYGGTGRQGVGMFAVPVVSAVPGTPILLNPSDWVAEVGFPQYAYDPALFKKVFAALNHPYGSSWPDGIHSLYPREPAATLDGDSGAVLEFSKIQLDTGWMIYGRGVFFDDSPSTHIAAYSPNGFELRPMVVTPLQLPQTRTCVKKFGDKYVFFGNEGIARLRLFFGLSLDGITWNKRDCYWLDSGTSSPVWAGTGKAAGPSYPDCIELLSGDYLAAYSVRGKEIVRVARFTPEGLKGAGNLVTHPNDFKNASYWVKTRSTVTPYSVAAPDGHPGGTLFANTAVTGTKLLSTPTAVAFTDDHTMSIYVKPTADGSFPYLRIIETTGIAFAVFDTTGAGAVGNSGGSAFVAAGIEAAADGWYRIWMTADYGSVYRWGVGISLTNDAAEAPSIAGTTECSLYVWGARMEPGTTVGNL